MISILFPIDSFYNTDNTGELSFKDLQSLIRDLNLNEIDPKRISVLADEIWKKIRDKDRLSLEAFEKAIQKRIIKGTEKLLISSKPILQLVMEKNKIKHHHQDRSSKSIRKPKSKLSPTAREKGVCNSCRPQNYQICLHCVCFDSDGRCVKPLRLFDGNLSKYFKSNIDRERSLNRSVNFFFPQFNWMKPSHRIAIRWRMFSE